MSQNPNGDSTNSDDGDDRDRDQQGQRYPPFLLNNRERGLTPRDREYLVSGLENIENEQVRSNTRVRIRNRLRESIIDFWLVSMFMSEYDRDFLFKKETEQIRNWEFLEGIKHAMQFFYLGLEENNLVDGGFETVLTSAIHDAEQQRHDGPLVVETDFDVDVDEQMQVQDAYQKFRRGAPLNPEEVGQLLVTGRVDDPDEIERLAQHARGHGLIESTISPIMARELADFGSDEQPSERIATTLAHLPDEEMNLDDDEEVDWPSVRSGWWKHIYDNIDPEKLAGTDDLEAGDPMSEDVDDDS